MARGTTPAAILLSGGGNDVAGQEFEMLLDHAASPVPGLNAKVVEGVLRQRVFLSYTTIIEAVTKCCEGTLGRPVRIIVHGYDHPVPDGRGWMWGIKGPWLKPGFDRKGYPFGKQTIRISADLIDEFNAVVASLPKVAGFSHVTYLDLRGVVSPTLGDKKLWDNELHPTDAGFAKVAARFAAAITAP